MTDRSSGRTTREHRTDGRSSHEDKGAAVSGEPDVERSLTIGATAEVLHGRWRDPDTLARVMAGFATVRASADGRLHWEVDGPLGLTWRWDSETIEDVPGTGVGWRSLPGGDIPNEGLVRFRPAPVDRGSVATLSLRFKPPGGVLGDAAVKMMGHKPLGLVADGVLRRFKSLVETGEIPTLERQPAARDDPT